MTARICSADHFFMQDGKYNFDPSKLGEAHNACLRKFVALLEVHSAIRRVQPDKAATKVTILRGIPGCGKSTYVRTSILNLGIVVDNTNLSISEVAPYAALALAYGFQLDVISIYCDPALAFRRNVHGVPLENVQGMADRMANSDKDFWPPWWNCVRVVSE